MAFREDYEAFKEQHTRLIVQADKLSESGAAVEGAGGTTIDLTTEGPNSTGNVNDIQARPTAMIDLAAALREVQEDHLILAANGFLPELAHGRSQKCHPTATRECYKL